MTIIKFITRTLALSILAAAFLVIAVIAGRHMWREVLGVTDLEARVDAIEQRESGYAGAVR